MMVLCIMRRPQMAQTNRDPLLTVKLTKGLAERQRLSLAHVINVLDEIRQMICETGRKIQEQQGMVRPSGDFGLELLAGAGGVAFHPGSIEANIAFTQNINTGVLAAQEVVRTIELLDTEEAPGADPHKNIDMRIVRRLGRIARIQRVDKTELELAFRQPGKRKPIAASFGDAAMAAVRSLQTKTFSVEGITIYGKLYELLDHDPSDEERGKGFWGELRRDNGEIWRLQFEPNDLNAVTSLFSRQASVTGKAIYYRATTPKLVVQSIKLDSERDYEAAFDELLGCDRSLYNADLNTLLRRLHGDE